MPIDQQEEKNDSVEIYSEAILSSNISIIYEAKNILKGKVQIDHILEVEEILRFPIS